VRESETEWWEILHAREPTLSRPYALGMMGWIARVAVCGAGCACLQEREIEESLQTGLARLGYRAVPPITISLKVHQLPQKGLRSQRELAALLEWTACALRPPYESVCLHQKQATSGMGLAAYPIWIVAFEQVRGSEQASLRKRAAGWGEWKQTGSDFLRELAGKQRTPYALRLLRAADLLEEEADIWAILSSSGAMENARSEIEKAARLAQSAAGYIAEATFLTMHLAAVVQNTLQDLFLFSSPTALAGVTLQEMVYLARTGTPPLRLLAARRMAGTDEPASISALSQLLFDTDTPTAETALWALQQMPHSREGRFVPLFIHVFRTLESETEETLFPLRRSLLQALSAAPGETAAAYLSSLA
jgi:hypothetical protein